MRLTLYAIRPHLGPGGQSYDPLDCVPIPAEHVRIPNVIAQVAPMLRRNVSTRGAEKVV
jgi:hypothetical protein